MPRKAKVQPQASEPEAPVGNARDPKGVVEAQPPLDVQPQTEAPPVITKADYIKARATIKQFRETQKTKPKRACTEKQLAALAAGRAKNQRFKKKQQEAQ